MNKGVRFFLGLLLSIFFLWLTFRKINLHALRASLGSIRLEWVGLALVSTLGTHAFRSVRGTYLLKPLKKLTPFDVFPILMFGFLVNNFLPGRAGELAKSVAAGRRFNIPTSSVLGTVAMERLSDLIGLLSIVFLASTVFASAWKAIPLLVGAMAGLAIIVGGIFWFVKRQSALKQRSGLVDRITTVASNFVSGFQSLGSWKLMVAVITLSVIIWWSEALTVWILSQNFSLSLGYPDSAALLSGLSIGVAIPASPGYVGTYEYFGKETLRLLGRPETQAVAFVMVLHLFQISVTSILGLPVLFGIKK